LKFSDRKLQRHPTIDMRLDQTRDYQPNITKHNTEDFHEEHDSQFTLHSDFEAGDSSPGCAICNKGACCFLYLIEKCTRNCFFCPRDRTEKIKRFPRLLEVPLDLDSVEEYIEYLKHFQLKGTGITGGEPFLAFDLLVKYIRSIRSAFGSGHHIWVYTNGDLVTKERLSLLEKIGLNEIRFDLSARDYDLAPVELAADIIENVTLQIPAMPEDIKIMMDLLEKLDGIGVNHLVINQLISNEFNQDEFRRRGYTLLTDPFGTCVQESELAALEILEKAKDAGFRIGIRYCSIKSKAIHQGGAFRRRFVPFCQDKFESTTRTGFIRRLSLGESSETVFRMEQFEKAIVAEQYHPIKVTYFKPKVQVSSDTHEVSSNILIIGSKKLIINKLKIGEFNLDNRIEALIFYNSFIKNRDNGKGSSDILTMFKVGNRDLSEFLNHIENFRSRFQYFEYYP